MGIFKNLFTPARVPMEEQLATLASCGIALRPGVSVDELFTFHPREKFETSPYFGLVITMGSEEQHEPFAPLSDNVWHLDTECIEAPGSYVRIAERMCALAQGDLRIENLRDQVDHDNGDAWLEFDLNGETVHWGARVKDDWIDPEMLSNFCGLLAAQNSARRFTFLDLKGQDCLLGCATEDELTRLRKVTGMRWAWLE